MFEGILAPQHIIIVGIIAILLFGDRLPEVMRSLGKGVSEFKKGMQGIQGALNTEIEASAPRNVSYQETGAHEEAAAPRFHPPTSEPRAETTSPDAATGSTIEGSTVESCSVHPASAAEHAMPSAAAHSP